MPSYQCPLCKQEVTKSLYEKITGIWGEKERRLLAIREKEKKIEQEALQMRKRFTAEKEKFEHSIDRKLQSEKRKFEIKIAEQQNTLKRQQSVIEKRYAKQLAVETNRILKKEQLKQKAIENELREKFEKSAYASMEKEKAKISKEKILAEKREKLQKFRNEQLVHQFRATQLKDAKHLALKDAKIKSLEEQVEKNKTPQDLGFLNERDFLDKLKKEFPHDDFKPTGKGGDILHFVFDHGKRAGVIMYELKKVGHFNKAHIDQALIAKQKREADYGILVTNAKRTKDDMGFSISKGVIIIHPAGAISLISILRDNLIAISRLNLTKEEKNKTIKGILEYIQGPAFSNSVKGIIQDTIDLYDGLKKEVQEHARNWQKQYNKFRSINGNAQKIDSNVVRLLISQEKKRELPRYTEIGPIPLPEKAN